MKGEKAAQDGSAQLDDEMEESAYENYDEDGEEMDLDEEEGLEVWEEEFEGEGDMGEMLNSSSNNMKEVFSEVSQKDDFDFLEEDKEDQDRMSYKPTTVSPWTTTLLVIQCFKSCNLFMMRR